MEWLQRLYENAMANMERRVGAFEDPENQWGFLLAILGAIVAGYAIHYMVRKKRRDDDEGGGRDGDDARW